MKKIKTLIDFTGYPSGAKEGSRAVDYEKGKEYDVPDDFAKLVVELKKHAEYVEVKQAPVPSAPVAKMPINKFETDKD